MLIDTHAHVNFRAYREDADQVIQRSLHKGVWMINVGSQNSTSKRAVEMAQKYSVGVYAAVGLHPIHLFEMEVDELEIPFHSRAEDFELEFYKELAADPKVVAIGETGLDYFHWPKNKTAVEVKNRQKEIFGAQINLARELDLPLMFHCRGSQENPQDAYQEMFEVLKKEKNIRGVIHCFGSDLKTARKFLDLGFYISFTGIITFKNARDLTEVARQIPLEKMLLETDAPYLAPEPYRGQRNEPAFVSFIGRKIAELKGVSYDEVVNATNGNVATLFKIEISSS